MPFMLNYTLAHPSKSAVPNPPGYLPPASSRELKAGPQKDAQALFVRARQSTDLKMRRAWDLALSPAKSLPMQGVMLYFSGSGVQIFSLGMIFMLLTSPITSVLNVFNAFEAFRPTPSTPGKGVAEPSYIPLIAPMVIYVAAQGLVLALGLWKCWSMGVLPTGSGDWLQFETRSDPPEWSAARAVSLG